MRFITRDEFTSVHMTENKTYRTLALHQHPISEFRYILTSLEYKRTVGTIPHIDRAIKKINIPFSIKWQPTWINPKLFHHPYPFTNNWVYQVYDFFDSSFILEDEKALIILVTAFEMIFLKKEKCKKEKLAKRSAVYFGVSDADIIQIYQEIKLQVDGLQYLFPNT